MDYEALGRYVEATDKIRDVKLDFVSKLQKFSDALKRADGSPAYPDVPAFNSQKLREQFNELAKLHETMLELGKEANIYAERCEKQKVRL